MPRIPKKNSSARTRKASTASTVDAGETLQAGSRPKLREMDGRAWHAETIIWWRDLWASPFAVEYVGTDRNELRKLAILEDDFNKATDSGDRLKLMAEIRLQRQCFGLTPVDRRRLQWTAEKPKEKWTPRPDGAASSSRGFLRDPRDVLDDEDPVDLRIRMLGAGAH